MDCSNQLMLKLHDWCNSNVFACKLQVIILRIYSTDGSVVYRDNAIATVALRNGIPVEGLFCIYGE